MSSTIHTATILATVILVVTGSNVFPTNFKTLPLILHHDSSRTKDLAWRSRNDFNNRILRPVLGVHYPAWYNGRVGDILEVFLSLEAGNIFSETNLNLIKAVEDRIFNFKDYKKTYCQKDHMLQCYKPWSVLRIFDGTYSYVDSRFSAQSFVNRSVLCEAMKFNETREYLKFFLEKDYNPCSPHSASKTRIFIPIGYPLVGGSSSSRIESFLVNEVKLELESIRDGFLKDRIDLYYMSEKLFNHDVTQQAYRDMMLAGGSFLFIFFFMWLQTTSFFITFFAIFSIITSYLLTNLIYRYAFEYEYFGFFHIIAMFIILGIGADDVFVFYDTWRLSETTKYSSKAHRLSDCYRKAAKTTFVTSLTTMVAFLVSAFSPLLPVRTFGLFSGILVGVNYVCDLIYFPTAIMLYTEKIKPWIDKCCSAICLPCCRLASCCRCTSLTASSKSPSTSFLCSSSSTDVIDHAISKPRASSISLDESSTSSQRSSSSTTVLHKPSAKDDVSSPEVKISSVSAISGSSNSKPKKQFGERNRVVVFLRNGFYDFLTLRITRFIVPIVFLGISIFFVYEATLLEPDSKQVSALHIF